jgi:uncharacterized membrane protein
MPMERTAATLRRSRPGLPAECDTSTGSARKTLSCSTRNISRREQQMSTVAGAALLAAGVSRGRASGLLLSLLGGGLLYRGWTGHCHTYDALGIDTAHHSAATAIPAKQGLKVEKSFTVNRPADEIYDYWQDLSKLPRIMQHLETVEVLDESRSRWVAKGPFGQTLEWEAEILEQRRPEMISWRSLPGSDVDSAGSVHFKPLGHDRGTALTVSLKYNPPGGRLGAGIAWLVGNDAEQQLEDDLSRFKSVMEAGEAPTTAGQPSGRA